MNQNTNNYLAEEKIEKLLLKFSIPCIMSLLVSSLYNIVDQIFIGRGVGYLGNGATNVVFPITVIKAEATVGFISMILFELFPLQITSIFGSEDGLYNEFAVLSFRIFLSMIILTCIQKSVSVFLQSLGKPVMAMGLSLLREFVLSVPLAIVLPMFFGVEGALFSAPLADVVTMVAVIIMARIVIRELNSKSAMDESETSEVQAA